MVAGPSKATGHIATIFGSGLHCFLLRRPGKAIACTALVDEGAEPVSVVVEMPASENFDLMCRAVVKMVRSHPAHYGYTVPELVRCVDDPAGVLDLLHSVTAGGVSPFYGPRQGQVLRTMVAQDASYRRNRWNTLSVGAYCRLGAT